MGRVYRSRGWGEDKMKGDVGFRSIGLFLVRWRKTSIEGDNADWK